jgi:hypothetical protein
MGEIFSITTRSDKDANLSVAIVAGSFSMV